MLNMNNSQLKSGNPSNLNTIIFTLKNNMDFAPSINERYFKLIIIAFDLQEVPGSTGPERKFICNKGLRESLLLHERLSAIQETGAYTDILEYISIDSNND